MSYRDDLNSFAEDMAKRNKNTWLILKITVALVAVLFVFTAIFFVIDMVTDAPKSPSVDDGGDLPTIRLISGDAIYMDYGANVSFKDKVSYPEGCTLKVDQSKLNKDVPGKYTVRYTVTDSETGKSDYLDVTVYVTKQEYSYATLMDMVRVKAERLGITSNMSKREKIEKVYEYININEGIRFEDESNTPNINRANWETDWIEEATRTLNLDLDGKQMRGDCYSYYAVSKAFFEYFGIEHVGIQRDNSKIDSKYGTHFWLMVNIGATGSNGQWYYYDATRLKYTFADGTRNSCLITLEKLQSYDKDGNLTYDFYAFDPAKYPKASTYELK